MKKYLVVAGNFAEFRNWQDKDPERKGAHYAMSVADIVQRSAEDFSVVFVGSYWRRGDLAVIREEIGRRGYEVREG